MSPTQSRKSPLAAFYTRHMSQIQRLPWDSNDTMHMDEVYVNLEWVQEEKKPTGTSSKPVPTYTSIFENTRQGITPKRILVRGKAGIGKTTFTQKMAIDWANATLGKKSDGVLSKYKHLLILNLRSIQPGKTLKEALEMQLSCSENEIKEIMDALDNDGDHVLLVFDGYDEFDSKNHKEITDIIHCRRYQDVCTIITTRPWKAEELMNPRNTDSVYDITGLTEDNIAEYIAKFFDEPKSHDNFLVWMLGSTGERLIDYLKQKKLMSLVKIPILLLFICLLWLEDRKSVVRTESLPASYTLLYKKLIQLLIRRKYNTKTQDETDKYYKNIDDTINCLGKLAYYGLLKPEGGLIFDENDLQSIPDIGEMYSLGLLNKTKVHYKFDVKQAITFPHKTIQEFFAARYLKENNTLDGNGHVLDQFLDSLHTIDELYNMDYVLRFVCGLSNSAATKVLERAKALQVESKKGEDISRMQSFQAHAWDYDRRYSEWCNDILLEHWYAHCTQKTVMPPELMSWHTALNIPASFEHSDHRFSQILLKSVERASKRVQQYSGIFKDVRTVMNDVRFPIGKTSHNVLSVLNSCDTLEKLLVIVWCIETDYDECRSVLNSVLSKALNLDTISIQIRCYGILSSIPKPEKLVHLKVHGMVNSQDIMKLGQTQSLKTINVSVCKRPKELPSALVEMPIANHGLTDFSITYTRLGAETLKILARNLHHVPGLESLKLEQVLSDVLSDIFDSSDLRSRSDMTSRCGASRCTCRGDTTKDDRCQDVCEAVSELSQGVKHTTKLKSFSLRSNNLGRYHGITRPLIALIQSLSTVSEQTGMKINMSDNELGKVDRLSDLTEAIVNSYGHVTWK
ncbi:NLR family CARD domain-containing protein 4-like [Lingula anatina]|uniref:NLR family CARD domain-containing protein 4-like n=1 Tax=Lingula anatina TaxID=7574 RepID=A0A1S3HD43_LINAN|nr:NLR family CARD domain-containing protein 4-like [Lingula anatina]|eukprot:XP_013383943.1 NLR family CARD domain-containing protein 4-like [Lingula anatina]